MIYLIVDENKQYCKIGFTDNPSQRLKTLQTANPSKLNIYSLIEGNLNTETEISSTFLNNHISNEWFSYSEDIYNYFQSKPQIESNIKDKKEIVYRDSKINYSYLLPKLEFPNTRNILYSSIKKITGLKSSKKHKEIIDSLIYRTHLNEIFNGSVSLITLNINE